MEEGKKKMIMIGLVVACIAAAVIVTVMSRSGSSVGGINSMKRGEAMFWIKCRDPKCENTWQMDKKDYYDYMEKHRVGTTAPALVCPKCGAGSGYRAEKCEKCEFIFERGTSNDLADRCPKCGYSKLEAARKKAGGAVKTPAATEEKK